MWLDFALAASVAWAVSIAFGYGVIAAGVLDAPTSARKVQTSPTPTSGGIAAGAGFAAGLSAATFLPGWTAAVTPDAARTLQACALFSFFALALGVADDLKPLSARLKLGALIGAAILFALIGARAEALPISAELALPLGPVLGVAGSALWIFTLVNATNFVDGANGLAMGSSAISLTALAVVSLIAGAPHVALLCACGAAGLIGFLVWNFPSGRLFAGDAGSLFAGMLGATAALAAVKEGVSPLIPPILFFPTLADVLLTLAYRVKRRGRDLLDGHREHLYQIGMRAGLSHVRVSMTHWAATAHCGLVGIVAAFAPRVPLVPPGDLGVWTGPYVMAATLAASAPFVALVVLALVALRVSAKIRKYASARGLDTPT